MQHQQWKKRASQQTHSPTGEEWTGSISRGKREQAEALTSWRGDRQHQQGQKTASKESHLPTGDGRTGSISRGKRQQGKQRHSHSGVGTIGSISRGQREHASRDTHILERGLQASAEAKESKQAEALTAWRREDGQHQQGQKK